jgi:hypothetical protein
MRYMVVRWDSGWHETRPDDTEERAFARDNGGEVVRASLESERLADRLAQRLDNAEHRRQLYGELPMPDLESLALPLFGARWKRAAARFLGVDARRVRRWASGQATPEWVFERLGYERVRRQEAVDARFYD